jgi:hypothetical protein
MEKTNNIFMEKIYNKKKFSLKNRLDFFLFLRKLKKGSPDLNLLIHIAEFIELLEGVYMYDNSSKNELFTTPKISAKWTHAFTLYNKQGNFYINFFMNGTLKIIHIDIDRMIGRKLKSVIEFEDGAATITTQDDEQLFINIISWLMEALIELLKKYYKMKKF